MRKVLLVDGMPFVYSCHSTLSHLANSKGESTGMAFGFMRSMNKYKSKLLADKVVICWDVAGGVVKAGTNLKESYKANRVMTPERQKMYDLIPNLKIMLGFTNFTQAEMPGYEADDLLGVFSKRLTKVEDTIVYVATTDRDLYQVVSDRVLLVKPSEDKKKKEIKVLTPTAVKDETGIYPGSWAVYKVFAGDKSDNVVGLVRDKDGLAMIKAFLLGQFGDKEVTLPLFREAAHQEGRFDWVSMMDNHKDEFESRYRLLSLATPDSININKGTSDKTNLAKCFEAMESKTLLKDIDLFLNKDIDAFLNIDEH